MLASNFLKTIFLTSCIAFAVPATSFSAELPTDSSADAKEVTRIVERVYEIQAMDKANLSPSEKRSLKKELKELKKQANTVSSSGHGVYLSIGAIIIIILLLILLL